MVYLTKSLSNCSKFLYRIGCLGWKVLPGKNALAYLTLTSVTKKKVFNDIDTSSPMLFMNERKSWSDNGDLDDPISDGESWNWVGLSAAAPLGDSRVVAAAGRAATVSLPTEKALWMHFVKAGRVWKSKWMSNSDSKLSKINSQNAAAYWLVQRK